MSLFNSNLFKRVAAAAVLAPIVIGAALWENPFAWTALILVAVFLSLIEYAVMAFEPQELWDRMFVVMTGTLLCAFMMLLSQFLLLLGVWVILVICLGLIIFSPHPPTAGARLGKHFVGVFLIAYLLSFAGLIKQMPDGGRWVLFTLTIVWFGDTGAYFMGKTLGRHKLAPLVSPNKTWEGSFGGLLASMGAGALAMTYVPGLTWVIALSLGALVGIMGQFGDLAESLVKRTYNVKDSGNLIPGHGGMLDRIDAVLFAAPMMFIYLYVAYSQTGR